MPEIGTSGLMSGVGKQGGASASVPAPSLDSTCRTASRSVRRYSQAKSPAPPKLAYNCRMLARRLILLLVILASVALPQSPAREPGAVTLLKPARVFDGETMHEGWAVRVRGDRVEAAGPLASLDASGAMAVELPDTTLMPGLVEGHSHILLHAYNETTWNDQVAHEGLALRAARAVNHLRATLMAGFTTVRDLGTEGAGYADVNSNRPSIRASCPARASSLPRALSWPPAVMPPKASPWNGTCRKAPKRPMAWTASLAWCATRLATARTGSSSTATIDGARFRVRAPPSRSMK